MSNRYRRPSKDASYQVSIHLAKRLERRFFRNQPIRNKNPPQAILVSDGLISKKLSPLKPLGELI
jgi:hypothetical protein